MGISNTQLEYTIEICRILLLKCRKYLPFMIIIIRICQVEVNFEEPQLNEKILFHMSTKHGKHIQNYIITI